MKYRKRNGLLYIVLILIAIGILSRIGSNPMAYIIPLTVFGIVFILYKLPPSQLRRAYMKMKQKEDKKTKKAKFRVIQGNKTDDDEKPPYH